ncbi:hypothetical protein JR736_004592 [Escherichia coli]|nr:hypothetical protein [Escherichia coli]
MKNTIKAIVLGLGLSLFAGGAQAIDCPTLKNVATHIANKHLNVQDTFTNNIIEGARGAFALNLKDGEVYAYIGLSGHLYNLAYENPGQNPVDVFYNNCQKDGAEPTTLGLTLAGKYWVNEVDKQQRQQQQQK